MPPAIAKFKALDKSSFTSTTSNDLCFHNEADRLVFPGQTVRVM